MARKQARRWCFTWNNYTEDDILNLVKQYPNGYDYCMYGKEIAPDTKTPHLQGYVEFANPLAMTTVKSRLDPNKKSKSSIHVEICNGNRESNITYCSKTGDITEIGTPKEQGARTDLRELYEFIQENPDMNRIAERYPAYCVSYYNNIDKLVTLALQGQMKDNLLRSYAEATPRPWQKDLMDELKFDPDDRKVIWYYDEIGNQGKTWLSKFLLAKGDAAYFTNGKTTDIAHAYNGERIAIFDFSRTLDGKVNYGAIECVKNGVLFSPKYNSTTKVFKSPWVICMANFKPNFGALSRDRWSFRTLKDGASTPTDIPTVTEDLANITM